MKNYTKLKQGLKKAIFWRFLEELISYFLILSLVSFLYQEINHIFRFNIGFILFATIIISIIKCGLIYWLNYDTLMTQRFLEEEGII